MTKNFLVLAGGSERNRAWGEACTKFLKNHYDAVYFMPYDHWEKGEKNIDFGTELEKLREMISGSEGEWFVVAKSIGSILTLKAVEADIINPSKCVFFGMPFSVVKDSVLKEGWSLLENFKIPSLEFHNNNDPTAEYDLARDKISQFAPQIQMLTLEGDNHDYLDFSDYESKIISFIE